MRISSLSFLIVAVLALNLFTVGVVAQPDDREPFTIKLDPIADINPVKTQHTFVATVLDNQGRPVAGQRVDWILSRASMRIESDGKLIPIVGDIVEHDDMNAIVDGTNEVIKKLGNHYTVTYTNDGPVKLTKGTPSTSDDIALGVGQTWITITSPLEGETHVIAFCPGIRNADRHKTFAIKYWIDAKITWPENAVNKVGEEHIFKFNLIKASTQAPMSGYLVRWTLIENEKSPKAHLGSEAGNTVVETETDSQGTATVALNQDETIEGSNIVRVELRKPTGELLAVRNVTKRWIAPKLQIEKKGPAEGILEEEVPFTIEISNPGDADAQDVVIRDKVQDGFQYMRSDLEPDSTEDGELVWNIGTLAKDAKKKFTVVMKARKVGELQNTAVLFSRELKEPISATAIVKIGAPKVYIIKNGLEEVRKGAIAKYELTIKNTGNAVAKNVVVRDTIPAGLQFRNRKSPMTLKWNLGNMQPKEEKKISYSLRAIQVSQSNTDFTNIARAYVQRKEVHKASHRTKVVAPELKLEKKGPRLMYLHRSGSYTIKIINSGNGPALDLVLTDTLPEHLDFISAAPRGRYKPAKDGNLATITWKIAEIAANTTSEIKLEVRAKKRGQCKNMAKLISNATVSPPVPAMNAEAATKIIGVPAMHISTYDTEDPCEIGRQTIYVLEARNEGTSPCTNVILVDDIPKEMEFIEAEGPTGHKYDEVKKRVTFEPFPILQPGDKLTYRVRCKAIKKGSAKNTARMNYDQFDQEILDEEGTSVYE